MGFIPPINLESLEPKWAGYAKPGPWTTLLSQEEEPKFESWVRKEHIPWQDSPTADYDMRGYWKAMQERDPNARTEVNRVDQRIHFPDTYKTPYHQTFSRQSKYALPSAGDWIGEVFAPPNVNTEPGVFKRAVQRSKE